jgi:hypothetical protein
MIRPIECMIIRTCLVLSCLAFDVSFGLNPHVGEAYAQGNRDCLHRERYEDATERCTDISSDDAIAIGSVRVSSHGPSATRKVVLHDEDKGDIELLLTPSLIQAVDESPAESYEVEGALVNGQMIVKALRPIE